MTTACSFSGVSFRFRGSGGRTFPTWDAKQVFVEKVRPNDSSILQDTGADVQRLALVVRCTKAQLIDLYGVVLESGSLIFPWETHTAFMENMDGCSQVVSGSDVYEATLHMIRL